MITVIGVDGSPLSRSAAAAVAGATLLVGGRRHLAAAGWSPEEYDRGTVPAGTGASPGGPPSAPGTGASPGGPPSAPGTGASPGGPPSAPGTGASPGGPPAPGTGASPGGPPSAPGTGPRPRVVVMGPLRPALDALAAHDGDAVVLASGDPGFFGIVRALRDRGLDCVVLPAISSVAQAFAQAGLPWDDAMVVSAHGRELRAAVNVCRAHPKVAVLTGPGQGPAEIGAALAGWPRRLLVAEDLGAPGERLTEGSPPAPPPRGSRPPPPPPQRPRSRPHRPQFLHQPPQPRAQPPLSTQRAQPHPHQSRIPLLPHPPRAAAAPGFESK